MTIKPFAVTGNVGIGTNVVSPGIRLDIVGGNLKIHSPNKGLVFPDNSIQYTAFNGIPYGDSNVSALLSGPVTIGNLFIANTTISTSSNTGSLLAAGGAGIAGNLNVGGTASTFTGNVGIGTSTAPAGGLSVYSGDLQIGTTGNGLKFPDGTSQKTAAGPIYTNVNVASYLSGPVVVGNIFVANNTPSTNAASGALVVYGGAGVGGNFNVGGTIHASSDISSDAVSYTHLTLPTIYSV